MRSEVEAFQRQLENVRMAFQLDCFDDDDRDQMLEDLGKARDQMEIAWLAEKPVKEKPRMTRIIGTFAEGQRRDVLTVTYSRPVGSFATREQS